MQPKSTAEHFRESLVRNVFPTITGLIVLAVLAAMTLGSCVSVIRKQVRFIPFHVLHWGGAAAVYLLLVVHGVNYYNPSFWKWLIPIVVFVVLDRLYWIYLTDRFTVRVQNAGAYDDVSRVAIVEVDKPSGFKFEVGQYIMLRLPRVGECRVLNYHASACGCTRSACLSILLLFFLITATAAVLLSTFLASGYFNWHPCHISSGPKEDVSFSA